MTHTIIVGLSLVFQLTAATLAIRLMRSTGRQVAWGLIAVGMSIIALRRILSLYESVSGSGPLVSDPVYDLFGIMVSMLFCIGVMRISPFFSSVQKTASALHETEETLRQSEDRYSKVLSASTLGISVTGLEDGVFLDVNDAFLSIHGYPREEVIGKSSTGLNMWVDQESRQAMVNLVRDGQKLRDFEILARRKSGEIRTVLFTGELITVDGKECILGLMHDVTERLMTERALRKSEEKFHTYFDMGLVGMAICSQSRAFLEVNMELCRMLGYEREELLKKTWVDLTHPDDVDANLLKFQNVLDRKTEGFVLDKRFIRKDGRVLDVTISVRAVLRQDGAIDYLIALVQDVTGRKKAEKELVNLRKAVDASGEIIFMTDREGVFTFVNPAFTELYGFTGGEIIGKSTPRILKGESIDPAEYEIFWRHILGKERLRREMINRTRAGQPVIIENSVNPVLDERGEISGFLSIQKDITEERRMKEDLEEGADRFRQLTESIREVFWIRDTVKNQMIYVSPAYEAIWGRTAESLLASPFAWAEAVHPDDRERVVEAAKTQQTGGTYDQEFRIMRPSGDIRWIRARAFPVRSSDNNIRRVVGVAEDITERTHAEEVREELEAQLQQAQRLESLGTLASGIAHDFNNILAIIAGHAALVGSSLSDPTRAARSVDTLQKACDRGTALVSQLLMLARKSDAVLEPVQIADIVADVVRLLGETFPRNIVISSTMESGLPAVLADGTQIHQVLLNLCVNARDAMPGGGTLTISTSSVGNAAVSASHPECLTGEYVRILVKDTGLGMDEETKRRIFEPFFTTKPPGKGTGLGLSLVFSLVRNHQGWVDVDSSPGRGTTISVLLPASGEDAVPAASAEEDFAAVAGGRETVLVIEDEEMLRDLVSTVLGEKGYNVIVASDGEEGVALFQAHRVEIDLVVSDVGLPKLTGEEVFRRVRAIDAYAPVVLVSGFIEPGTRADLLATGAKAVIQKPFLPAELLRTVRSILDAKKETGRG